MRNPELTRAIIIQAASELFNTQGYKATSISDITKRTNLTKGAIYRHFADKSSLEKEALRSMCQKLLGDITYSIKAAKDSKEKLQCIINYFSKYADKPPFKGGCPLMNAAIEADDNNAELKGVVQYIMSQIYDSISLIIENGIKHGQIKKNTEAKVVASWMISSLEGAIMMMKIFDNKEHLKNTIQLVEKEIKNILI